MVFTYAWMNRVEYITEDRRVVIDQPAAIDAIQWWADLMNVRNVASPLGATGGGKYPVSARTLYYQVRPFQSLFLRFFTHSL